MRLKRKTSIFFKKLLSVVLVLGAFIGAISLINHIVVKADDGKQKVSPIFEVGGLTNYGKYSETDQSIYTKSAFKSQGLSIVPCFDNNISYQVFFYDDLGNFVKATEVLTEKYNSDLDTECTYSRIVITPQFADTVDKKDRIVRFYEVLNYSTQLTIKVNSEQLDSNDLYIASLKNKQSITWQGLGDCVYKEDTQLQTFVSDSTSNRNYTQFINCADFSTIVLKIKSEALNKTYTYSNGTVVTALHLAYRPKNSRTWIDSRNCTLMAESGAYSYVEIPTHGNTHFILGVVTEFIDSFDIWLI